MFEATRQLWKQYASAVSQAWAPDDPRHGLGSEATVRLEQLDIILENLERALESVQPDSVEAARNREWLAHALPSLQAGEMTPEDYLSGFAMPVPSPTSGAKLIRGWAEVQLFTETFYMVAWRLMEVINGKRPRDFPGLGSVPAIGITIVRNHLIQHPEKHGHDYRQSLVVTSCGPVLKATAVRFHESGDTGPTDESVDRGLYVNARQLHDELSERLKGALERIGSGTP